MADQTQPAEPTQEQKDTGFVLHTIAGAVPVYAASENSNKPVTATGIELVKKVTLKGPAGKGGKPATGAATGIVADPISGQKYAVVVGINDYPDGSQLEYCVNDANEMADVLITYGFAPGNVTRVLNKNATKSGIQAAINNVNVTSNDEFVFFFSGHGAKAKIDDGDSRNTDQSIVVLNEDGTDFDYIWDGNLVQWFNGFKAGRIVFIFDSCLSGGMSVLKGSNRIVNMACSANGLSYESDYWGGGHGQFTYYFAEEGMDNGLAYVRPDDNQVTVEEAFDYAKTNCIYQTPTIADGFTNDLLP